MKNTGLKLLDKNQDSITNYYGKIHYTKKWQTIPGNGCYVAITGGLYSYGHTDIAWLIEYDPESEVDVNNNPCGVKCYSKVRLIKKYTGRYIEWYPDGKKYCERNYKNGELEGKYIRWYDNGEKYCERNYKNGELEGKYIRWYNNGKKYCERNYKNGELEGKYIEYYRNGEKYRDCNYKNGKLEGKYIMWYDDGKKWRDCNYKNGKIEGEL